MASLGDKLAHAWNAFRKPEDEFASTDGGFSIGASYGSRPDRTRIRFANERSIVTSVYVRLAMDCANIDIRHVQLDAEDRYLEDRTSGLNDCLTIEANLDQAATAFRQDIMKTIFDNGVAAIVPVDTTINPNLSGGYDIKTMRVGIITAWFPTKVRVSLWNEAVGRRQEIVLDKRNVAIVENPLYEIMNEPNSTLQRLIVKLGMLDAVDEASSSGKLDLIVQLPYVIKSEARREQAEQRRTDLEFQLKGSKYGIGYTDATEKITQLNRPAENNLLAQVEYLTGMLYGQLGITPEIMNGTADEKTMLNYYNRAVKPILDAVVEAMRRAFLTKTARSQKQSIMYFRDAFALVPIADLAESADKLTRNEILTSNEVRQVLGFRPAKDPNADALRNSNMPHPDGSATPQTSDTTTPDTSANDALDAVDSQLDDILSDPDLGGDDEDA